MTSKYLTSFAFLCLAGPALADDLCDDLWLSRNAVFDNAGFCFRSNLGQSLFDNADCSTQSPDFDERQQANIARISEFEAASRCDVDVNRRSLDVPDADIRTRLTYQPVARRTGDICQGYIGPAMPMRTAPFREGSDELGALAPGDILSLRHETEANWTYVTVLDGDTPTAGGWIAASLLICEAWSDQAWDE